MIGRALARRALRRGAGDRPEAVGWAGRGRASGPASKRERSRRRGPCRASCAALSPECPFKPRTLGAGGVALGPYRPVASCADPAGGRGGAPVRTVGGRRPQPGSVRCHRRGVVGRHHRPRSRADGAVRAQQPKWGLRNRDVSSKGLRRMRGSDQTIRLLHAVAARIAPSVWPVGRGWPTAYSERPCRVRVRAFYRPAAAVDGRILLPLR